ncbi:hypothetical protein NECID01_0341 [Nematocida sp. AWRm77]|nr:hypothetical protein NECID01_0341 [Nematocida sp. AWRm77]
MMYIRYRLIHTGAIATGLRKAMLLGFMCTIQIRSTSLNYNYAAPEMKKTHAVPVRVVRTVLGFEERAILKVSECTMQELCTSENKQTDRIEERQVEESLSRTDFEELLSKTNFSALEKKDQRAFAFNMVGRGLAGAQSQEILEKSRFPAKTGDLVFWRMIIAFAETAGMRCLVYGEAEKDKGKDKGKGKELRMYGINDMLSTPYENGHLLVDAESFPEHLEVTSIGVIHNMHGIGTHTMGSNGKVLGWLACHANILSLHIRHTVDFNMLSIFKEYRQFQLDIARPYNTKRASIKSLKIKLFPEHDMSKIRLIEECIGLAAFSLSTSTLPSEDAKTLQKALSACTSLAKLHIAADSMPDKQVENLLKCIPRVESLRFSLNQISKNTASCFAHCTGLKHLSLDKRCDNTLVMKTLLKSIPHIESVDIWCKRIDTCILDEFKKCKRLKKLLLHSSTSMDNKSICLLLECVPNIENLNINVNSFTISTAKCFRKCPRLRILYLGNSNLSSAVAKSLLESLLQIEELALEIHGFYIGIAKSFAKCIRLTKLQLINTDITTETAKALLHSLPLIKDLSVSFRDLGIEAAKGFETSRKLKKLTLDLSYADRDTANALFANLHAIEFLNIRVEELDSFLPKLLHRCRNLQRLIIRCNRYIPGALVCLAQELLASAVTCIEVCLHNRNTTPQSSFNQDDLQAKEALLDKGVIVLITYQPDSV